MPEVIGSAGLLFDPRSIQSIACGILRCAFDEELRDRLRSKGQAQALKFTWERTAKTTLDAYTDLLQGA